MTTVTPQRAIPDHSYGVWLISQEVSGGSFRAVHTVSKVELEAAYGNSWSARDARDAADRFDRLGYVKPPTCPVCHRRISGGLLTCQCAPVEPADDLASLVGQIDEWVAKAHRRLLTCGGTLMDAIERREFEQARKELRTAQTLLADMAIRLPALTAQPIAAD